MLMGGNMKKRDIVLLTLLRQNSRESLVRLSKKSFMPVSTIYEKLKGEFKRYVKKYTAIIDHHNIGFPIHAFMLLKVQKEDKNNVEQFLSKHHLVNSIYRINNSFDFIVEFYAPSINKLDDAIDLLNDKFAILDVMIYFVSREIGKEIFLNSVEHAALLYEDAQMY